MQVFLGADHAGFELKEKVKQYLRQKKIHAKDLGNAIYDSGDDYPVFAEKVGKAVARSNAKGILFCGTSEGICIAANKIKRIRAVAPSTAIATKLSREHNDANVLCIAGGKTKAAVKGLGMPFSKAKKLIDVFLTAKFSGVPRHRRRILQIKELEK